jgi:hypothetical protein
LPVGQITSSASPKRRHALDLDQHFWIGQRLDHAGGAGGIGRRPERAGIQRIHRGDVGRARQQYVDLDEIAEAGAGVIEHALDIGDDKAELGLEAIREGTLFVEAGDARNEQQVAGAGGEGQRRGFDAGGWGEVLDGHGAPLICSARAMCCGGLRYANPPYGLRTSELARAQNFEQYLRILRFEIP